MSRYAHGVLAADAPSITDWMQGWGSIVGVLFSAVAVIFTGWLLRHEIRVRREEKADADAAQARLVVAYIVGMKMTGVDDFSGAETGPMTGVRWQIKNHSQAPIFDAFISVNGWKDDRWGEVIEGEASGTVKCDPPEPFDSPPFDPREALVKVEFTDAAGLRWSRTMSDPPKRVTLAHPRYVFHLGPPGSPPAPARRWTPGLRGKRIDKDPPF